MRRTFSTILAWLRSLGSRAGEQIAKHQRQSPRLVILVVLLTLIPSLLLASQLRVKSSFRELLPEGKPSVRELDRLDARLGGMETLTIVVEGKDADTLRAFMDAISPRLMRLGPEWVTGVDDGMRHIKRFVQDHWWVYLGNDQIQKLRDDLRSAKEHEIAKRAGWDLGIDDEPSTKSWNLDDLRKRMTPPDSKRLADSMPDYYIGENGTFGAMVVRTPLRTADPRAKELQRRVSALADEVAKEIHAPDLKVRYTGSLVTSAEEHRIVIRDLTHVGLVGIALVLGIVFLYFLRFRALIAMAVTVSIGTAWTFAFARLAVGHLNSATGFLASIIVGNGINFGIVYMARYLEARHDDELSVHGAIERARHDTWRGTLTAAVGASVAYGSLAITSFPGFRQFGIIGGLGMLSCWGATYLLLPAILIESERLFPIQPRKDDWRRKTQWFFSGPLFALASRAPRTLANIGMLAAILGSLAGAYYIARDPMEYDLTQIRNDSNDPDSARALGRRVAKVVGSLSRDGRALVVDRREDVAPLVAELNRRREAAPSDREPFGRVVSILDFVPNDQGQKLAAAQDIVDLVRDAQERHLVDDATWERVAPLVPAHLRPLGMDDLPSDIVWPFEEADGSRGRIVYMVPTKG